MLRSWAALKFIKRLFTFYTSNMYKPSTFIGTALTASLNFLTTRPWLLFFWIWGYLDLKITKNYGWTDFSFYFSSLICGISSQLRKSNIITVFCLLPFFSLTILRGTHYIIAFCHNSRLSMILWKLVIQENTAFYRLLTGLVLTLN